MRNGWLARALTGDIDQKKRLRILQDFKEGELPILVATDVASRGLHIEGVSHVMNWDLPQDPEDYVHRVGRTARAGAAGKAIALADEASALALEPIEKFIGQKIPVEWAEDEWFLAEIKPTSEERRRFAEERRQRLAARREQEDRWNGGRSGRGGGRPEAPAAPVVQAARCPRAPLPWKAAGEGGRPAPPASAHRRWRAPPGRADRVGGIPGAAGRRRCRQPRPRRSAISQGR